MPKGVGDKGRGGARMMKVQVEVEVEVRVNEVEQKMTNHLLDVRLVLHTSSKY